MKSATRQNLRDAYDYCVETDRSAMFMIQYIMDYAKVSHETVIKFLESLPSDMSEKRGENGKD